MTILHFIHPSKPEYIVLHTDEDVPYDDYARPGYSLSGTAQYDDPISGSENGFPLDCEMVSQDQR